MNHASLTPGSAARSRPACRAGSCSRRGSLVLVGSNRPCRSTSRTTAVPVSVLSNSVGRPRSIVPVPDAATRERVDPSSRWGRRSSVARRTRSTTPDRVSHDARRSAGASASRSASAPWWRPGRSRGRRSHRDRRSAGSAARRCCPPRRRRPPPPSRCRRRGCCGELLVDDLHQPGQRVSVGAPCSGRNSPRTVSKNASIASGVSGVISFPQEPRDPASLHVSLFGKSLSAAARSICSNCLPGSPVGIGPSRIRCSPASSAALALAASAARAALPRLPPSASRRWSA